MDSTSLTRGHIRHLCAVTSPQDVFMNLTCAPNDLRVKPTARPVCAAFVSCVTVCMCVCVCVCVCPADQGVSSDGHQRGQ